MKITTEDIKLLKETVKRDARPLEYELICHLFEENSEAVLKELKKYKNKDGGFGNALEPDLRVPDSSALATEFAINILDRITFDDKALLKDIVSYLEDSFNHLKGHWVITPETVEDYPRAVWWNKDAIESFGKHNPSATLLGFLYKHREYVTKLDVEALITILINEVLEQPVEKFDAHTIFCLVDLRDALPKNQVVELNKRINEAIESVIELDAEKWVNYVPEPIKYIKRPEHDLYIKYKDIVDQNVEYLFESLGAGKVWEVKHKWYQYDAYFHEHVRNEWMGIFTYDNLARLKNFNALSL